MPLPSKPYHEWTCDDLEQLVKEPKAQEKDQLDFKADCKLLSEDKEERKKAQSDILIDISAMANGVGGALIFGVRESGQQGHRPVAERIEGIENVLRLQQTIESLAATHLDIRPAPLRFTPIEMSHDERRAVLIVEVPQNIYSLSMVTRGQPPLNQFWVRRGWNNVLMTTNEIRYDFERLTKIRESVEDDLQEVRLGLGKRASGGPLIWVAIVPIRRTQDHIAVDVKRIQGIIEKSSYYKAFPNPSSPYQSDHLGTYSPQQYSYNLRPSFRGLALKGTARQKACLEISREGSLFFGIKGNALSPKSPKSLTLWTVYDVWCSGLYLFKDLQEHFSFSGAALAQAGLVGCKGMHVSVNKYDYIDCILSSSDICLDRITLDENVSAKEVFKTWAAQLSNCLDKEETICCYPWVPFKANDGETQSS